MTEQQAIIKANETSKRTGKITYIVYDCSCGDDPATSYYPATPTDMDTYFLGLKPCSYVLYDSGILVH